MGRSTRAGPPRRSSARQRAAPCLLAERLGSDPFAPQRPEQPDGKEPQSAEEHQGEHQRVHATSFGLLLHDIERRSGDSAAAVPTRRQRSPGSAPACVRFGGGERTGRHACDGHRRHEWSGRRDGRRPERRRRPRRGHEPRPGPGAGRGAAAGARRPRRGARRPRRSGGRRHRRRGLGSARRARRARQQRRDRDAHRQPALPHRRPTVLGGHAGRLSRRDRHEGDRGVPRRPGPGPADGGRRLRDGSSPSR